ncbi:MAG: hypothetical protein DBX55_02575 [Verrucomicrobia bacterium]|nr:MAG: hypothetical protein DBX55_02575 [Verrucomicrobiota bacterium]
MAIPAAHCEMEEALCGLPFLGIAAVIGFDSLCGFYNVRGLCVRVGFFCVFASILGGGFEA